MNGRSQPFDDSPPHAELSGILLQSVEEVLREPIEEEEMAQSLDRARRLGQATTPDRPAQHDRFLSKTTLS